MQKLSILWAMFCFTALSLSANYIVRSPYTTVFHTLDGVVPELYQECFIKAERETGFPAYIVGNLVSRVEATTWDPNATSPVRKDGSRDCGVFQHHSTYIAYFAQTYNKGVPYSPYNVAQAAPVTFTMLASYYKATGTIRGALYAYNCGLARTLAGNVPTCTVAYADKILAGTMYI